MKRRDFIKSSALSGGMIVISRQAGEAEEGNRLPPD